MFPSSGYFRVLPCPYFLQDECDRPHCHFKHSRPKSHLRKGTSSKANLSKKLPPFLHRSLIESKVAPSNSSPDILPDIFDHTESVDHPATSSSSPPAPTYSPLPESPPHLDPTASGQFHCDNTTPEIGEACEETFIFNSAPTSTDESKYNVSNEHEDDLEVPSECNTEMELLGSSSNHSDSDITFTPTSMNTNNTSPDEEGTFFLQPDVIAKLQAPLAPLKRRSESNTSETSTTDSLPMIKRRRFALTSEKRPNVLVMSKNAPKLSTNVIVIDRDSLYMPKSSRVSSNVFSSNATPSTKPSLPLTMDSKVPVKMRQKFLDKVFSEYVKVLPENDAHLKVTYKHNFQCILVSLFGTSTVITFFLAIGPTNMDYTRLSYSQS